MPLSNATIIAIICCLAGATLEGLLSGAGVKTRFAELRMPKYSPPFWLWMVIGIAYYGLCFFLLRNLFSSAERGPMRLTAIVLTLLLLVGNAVWNYLFFRRRSLLACVLSFIPYGIVVVALTVFTFPLYPAGSVMLLCYGLYLAYAAWWTYRLLKCNPCH